MGKGVSRCICTTLFLHQGGESQGIALLAIIRKEEKMKQENNNIAVLPAVVQSALTNQKINLDNVNLLLPTESYGQVIGEFDKVTIEVVRVDPDQDQGDVFEISRGKLVLSSRPLMKISDAIGIVWDSKTTGNVQSVERKSRAKATGAMRRPNGEWIVRTDEKTVDLDALEEEQRIKYEEDTKKGRPYWSNNQKQYAKWKSEQEKLDWIEKEVRRSMLSYRKFKDERALTGAQERVIRKFVALKGFYTKAELSKPFAFPRVVTDTSKMLQSPEGRQAAIDKMVGSSNAIFGGTTPEAKQLEDKPKYEVLDNGSGGEAKEEPAEKKPEEVIVPWGADPNETEEEKQLKEMIEDVRERRKKYDKNLPKEAKEFIDDILAREKYDFKTISSLVDRFNEFEKTAEEMGVVS